MLILKSFTIQVHDEGVSTKRKFGVFQSYDMNIDPYPHFSKTGKI